MPGSCLRTKRQLDAAQTRVGTISIPERYGPLLSVMERGHILEPVEGVPSLKSLSSNLQRQPTKLLFGDRREGYTPR